MPRQSVTLLRKGSEEPVGFPEARFPGEVPGKLPSAVDARCP